MNNISHRLGSFAGNLVNKLDRKETKKAALTGYLSAEAVFTAISIAVLISAKMYTSATIGILLFAFLIYATYGVLTEMV